MRRHDRTATEMWDALCSAHGGSCSVTNEIAFAGYPKLLKAVEAWHLFYEVHLDSCQECGHEELCDAGIKLQATALKLLHDVLATERARLQAAHL